MIFGFLQIYKKCISKKIYTNICLYIKNDIHLYSNQITISIMKAKYYTTAEGEKAIVNFLIEMCPKTENNYSLGFKRYSALSKAKKLQMDVSVFKDGFGYTLEAHNEVKRRLAEMTEEQYKQFKLSK